MLDFLTKYLERKVDTAVSREFEQIKSEVDSVPDELRSKLSNLNLDVSNVGGMVNKLRSKTFKAQGIEKIVFHPDYLVDDKVQLMSIAKNQFNLSYCSIDRFSFPIEVSKENTYFKVDSNCAIALKGLKFIEGDGWGRYQINRGTQMLKEFAKSKLIQEDGVLMNIYYYPEDVVSIRQIQGDGEVQVELLGCALMPVGFRYPLTKIKT